MAQSIDEKSIKLREADTLYAVDSDSSQGYHPINPKQALEKMPIVNIKGLDEP